MEAFVRKVKYYECDRMGVTHHSNYIRFMEEARVEMMDRIGFGFEKMEAMGIVSPVVSLNVDYRKTTTFQDEIHITLKLIEASALKIRFGYLMKAGGALVCKAESTHCFIENGRPIVLKDRFPEFYNAMAEALSED